VDRIAHGGKVRLDSEDRGIIRGIGGTKGPLRTMAGCVHMIGSGKQAETLMDTQKIGRTKLARGRILGIIFGKDEWKMKRTTAVTVLSLALASGAFPQSKPAPSDGKIRVFVDANSSTEFVSNGKANRGLFGGVSTHVSGTQYEHSQVPEVIKTLGERCPSLTVTMNKDRAYFLLSIEHESAAQKGLARRRNHVTVVNREGDVVFSKNDRELGNAVKDACASMRLTPEQISAYDAAIATAASEAAKASQAQRTTQPATTQATVMPAPVQAPSQAPADMRPQEESLGDVARRLKAQKAARKQQEPPNDKP